MSSFVPLFSVSTCTSLFRVMLLPEAVTTTASRLLVFWFVPSAYPAAALAITIWSSTFSVDTSVIRVAVVAAPADSSPSAKTIVGSSDSSMTTDRSAERSLLPIRSFIRIPPV